jgi:hypothetical protein
MIKKDILFSLKILVVLVVPNIIISISKQDFALFLDWEFYTFLGICAVIGGVSHHYYQAYKVSKNKRRTLRTMTRKDLYFGIKLLIAAVVANGVINLLLDGNISSLISRKFAIAAVTICAAAVLIRYYFRSIKKQNGQGF